MKQEQREGMRRFIFIFIHGMGTNFTEDRETSTFFGEYLSRFNGKCKLHCIVSQPKWTCILENNDHHYHHEPKMKLNGTQIVICK